MERQRNAETVKEEAKIMIRVVFYCFLGFIIGAITTWFLNRDQSYHGFMVSQSNLQENEYDRIYAAWE
jgi:hypothetical protein